MRRRHFIASMAVAGLTAAHAQPVRGKPRVAVIHPASVEASVVFKRLVAGLAQLGYADGKSITLDLRSAGGDVTMLPRLTAELLAAKPDVLIVVGPAAVRAAVAATQSVPIVAIDLESDPVAAGWMRSLSRPGGNVAGLFLDLTGMSLKWLQLLREAVPGVREVAFLWDTATGEAQLAAIRKAAAEANLRGRTIAVEDWGNRFDKILAAEMKSKPQAIVVLSSPVAFQYSEKLAHFTKSHGVAAISPFRPFPQNGGLMSYGPDLDLFFTRAPVIVDRLLRGASPAETAVEQPVKYELVINEIAARALKLELPRQLLLRADEVIR